MTGADVSGPLTGVPPATTTYARPEDWTPPRRSTVTCHRVPVDGRKPLESRDLPWWTWPFEILWRIEARLMRNQAPHIRDGLEPPRIVRPVGK